MNIRPGDKQIFMMILSLLLILVFVFIQSDGVFLREVNICAYRAIELNAGKYKLVFSFAVDMLNQNIVCLRGRSSS